MRKLASGVALGALLTVVAGVGGGAGCSTTQPTELVPGVISQIVVPRDLQTVRLTVTKEGELTSNAQFDECYPVGAGGVVLLPSTLGVLSAEAAGTTVTIEVRGYLANNPDDCMSSPGPVGETGAQVLRRSQQTFVSGHTLFVPMPLSYSCWNNGGCSDTQSCKGNQCVPATVAENALVDFDPSLVDGTGVCFDAQACFANAVTPILVDASKCTYAFPGPAPIGVNVRVYYQNFTWTPVTTGSSVLEPVLNNGGEREILSLDPVEGFQLVASPDAGATGPDGAPVPFAGQQLFQLAPGLCQLAQAASVPPTAAGAGTKFITISALEASNACAPKVPLLPFCAASDGGIETGLNSAALPGGGTTTDGICKVPVAMSPTQSAIYLAMDQSEVMYGAFGATGSATALSLSLSDPVFKRTSAAFKFFPGVQTPPTDCTATTTSYETPDIKFALAGVVQGQLGAKLLGWKAPESSTATCAMDSDCPAAAPVCANKNCIVPAPLNLQAALRLDTGAYAEVLADLKGQEPPNTAAVMFFLNRAPTLQNDCNPLLDTSGSPPPVTMKQAIEDEVLAAFNSSPSLRTFFVVLDDDEHDTAGPGGALTFFNQVQQDLPLAVTVLDATAAKSSASSGQTVAANFSKIVTQLGTCLYDYTLPPGTGLAQVQVKYTVPAQFGGTGDTIVPGASNCTEATQTTVDGWNVDNGRIRICGAPCANLRTAILGATGAALQENVPAPDIPVSATIIQCGAGDAGLPLGQVNDAAVLVNEEAGSGDDSSTSEAAAGDDSGVSTGFDATTSSDAATTAVDAGPG